MTHLTMETLLSLREAGLEPGDARPGSTSRAAPPVGASWTGCTSGWLGSRRCPRSVPAGTAGPRPRPVSGPIAGRTGSGWPG